MDYITLAPTQDVNENGLIYDIDSLYAYFERVSDTRKAKGKQYPLALLLLLMMLAKLGGEDKPSGMADWVANHLEQLIEMKILKKKSPSHMTYRRVLQETIQPEEFEDLISAYHQKHLIQGGEMVFGMDGKSLKGTIPRGVMRGVHLLSIYVAGQGLVLVQAEINRKENEIVVAPKVLKQVHLSGAIVIGDAMHAQRETSAQIVESGGDHLWTVKGNQARTEWAIQRLFVPEICNLKQGAPLSKHCRMASEAHKGHGRIEKRTILVSTNLNEYLDWPSLGQVFRLEREVWHENGRRRTRQIVYGLTSLTPQKASPRKLLALTRQYWGIESSLHYPRDVTLHEDVTRLTVGAAGHNMALNNLLIGLCLRYGLANLAKARRLLSAHPKYALRLILSTKNPFL